MSDCLVATMGGLSLVQVREDGTSIYVSNTPGWEEGAEVDFQSVPRAGGHGTFNTPVYVREFPFAIEGYAESPNHLASIRLERELKNAMAGGRTDVVAMQHEGDVALWVNAHLSARPSFERDTPTSFTWRFQLVSHDSFRYGNVSSGSTGFATDPVGSGLVFDLFAPDGVLDFGPVPTSDGTVTVSNPGSASAAPVFSIAGPGPVGGFSIADTGSSARVKYLGEVPAGSVLVIDSGDGSALLDGTADRSGQLVVTSWPIVPPESQATYRFAPESSPSAAVLTVDLTSTYY